MATKFQIKRTSVSGRTPNTTNSGNSSYIAAGELALNLTDEKMFSSNGTVAFEVGANLANITVAGNATLGKIIANGSLGTAGQALFSNSTGGLYWDTGSAGITVELVNSTSNVTTLTTISTLQFDENSGFNVVNVATGTAKVEINSTFKFWQVDGIQKLTATGLDTVNFIAGNNITITANGANTPQSIAFSTSLTPTFTSATFGNSTVNTVVNSTAIAVTKVVANGSAGNPGQVLTSNGTGVYWTNKPTHDITLNTFTGDGSTVNFKLSANVEVERTFIFLNGVIQKPTVDYTITNGTLTFSVAPALDEVIHVRILGIENFGDAEFITDDYTGNGSNTVYTLSTSQSSNNFSFVFLNGICQVPGTDYSISGSTLTFTVAPPNNEKIRVTSINLYDDFVTTIYTANGTATQFALPHNSSAKKIFISLNGLTQAPITDYTVTGSTVTFTTAPAANDTVIIRSFAESDDSAGANTTIQYNKSGVLGGSLGFTFNETTNNVVIGNTLTVPNFILNASNPPATSSSTGTTGTFAWDTSYFYIATGTNTWKKVPISTDGTVGAATAGSNTHVQFNDSGTLGATAGFTFNKATNNAVIANTLTVAKISANGTTGSNGQVLASNGTGIYWSDGGAGSGVGISKDTFTGNGSNTVFTLSDAPTDETHLMVYVDRVIQRDADYNVSGTTLSFVVAPDNGASIDAYIMTNATQLTPVRGVKTNTYTGNGSNTVFTLGSSSSNAAYTLVFVDTVFQPVSEYTVSGTTITFNTAPDNGVPIEVIQLGTGLVGDPQVGGANGEIQFNSSNTFGANNKFTFNPTTTTLALGSNVTINTSAIFIGNSTVNTTIIAGNVDLQGTQLRVGNVVVNGNQVVVGNVTITDQAITVGNSTVNTVLGQSGNLAVTTITANGSVGSNGQLLASNGSVTYWTDPPASTNTDAQYTWTNNHTFQAAFTIANTLTVGNSTVNTVINSTSVVAANLAGNGASVTSVDAATVGGNTASTLRSYSDTVAATAYSNGVAYAASNTYVNNTFLPLAGGTLTGALTVNATANVVANLAANNVTIRGDLQIDGNLVVSGTSVTINAASLAVEDNMIYLNNGSQVTDPDLGFAGNYNDGSYKHAGFFRDATDGVWKVFDGYTPEPDASAFIDTSNASFRIANFQANAITASNATFAGPVSGITTLAAGNTTITGFANVSSTLQVTGTSSLNSTTNIAGALAVSNTITACTTSTDALSIYRGLDVGSVGAAGLYFNMGALSGSTQTVGARLTSVLQANATHGYMSVDTRVAGSLVTQLTINNGVTTVNGSLSVSTNTATFGTTAYVVANGNVGIGTGTPGYKLDVNGTLNIPVDTWISAGGSSLIRLSYFGYSGGYKLATLGVTSSTSTGISLGADVTGNPSGSFTGNEIVIPNNRAIVAPNANNNGYAGVLRVTTDNDIHFGGGYQVNSNYLVISNANGNIGIGMSSPIFPLQVKTNSAATSQALQLNTTEWTTTVGSAFQVGFGASSGNTYSEIRALSEGYNAWNNLVIQSGGGNVGIGNTSPAATLHIFKRNTTSRTSVQDLIYLGTTHTDIGYGGFGTGIVDFRRTYNNTTAHAVNRISFIELGDSISDLGGAITFSTKLLSSGSDAPVERVRIDNAGRTMIGTTTANTTANTAFTVKGFTSNTAAFMAEFRSSDGTLRTSITDRGAQNWYIQAGDGLEKGSIRYSTPNGFVGILYFNSSGADRSDIRHVAGGGFTFHGHSLSTAPSTELMKIEPSGNVTISGTLTELSSIKLKENITPIEGALSLISNINGYTYDRIDGTAKMRAGLIAEEVKDVIPNVVQHDKEGNPLGIQYTNLIAYLIESIKELKAEIDILKSK